MLKSILLWFFSREHHKQHMEDIFINKIPNEILFAITWIEEKNSSENKHSYQIGLSRVINVSRLHTQRESVLGVKIKITFRLGCNFS